MKNIYNLGNDKNYGYNAIKKEEIIDNKFKKNKPKEPILRGCKNECCFCSGACREIIGWK